MSTEASRPIRDKDEWERGKEEWNLETGANPEDQGCHGPPPEQQPPGIAQQLPYHAIAVSTAMQNRVTKTMSVALLLGYNWSKKGPTLKPSSTPMLLISSGLTCGSSTTSLLLISPGPTEADLLALMVPSLKHTFPALCEHIGAKLLSFGVCLLQAKLMTINTAF